ncbi:MAG: DUF4340 domain-containing protein [Planctomycetota bacterium]
MKLTPLNWVLVVVLVLLLGLDRALRGQGPVEREVGRLLPELFLDQAQRVVLESDDERLEMRRVGTGSWVLPDHYDHPADASRMRFLLESLISITTLDLLTPDAERHAEYGVDEGALSVRVWNGEGRLLAGLLQGDVVPGGGASYVRRSGDDATYRAPGLRATIPLDPAMWLDVKWMTFEPTMVDGLKLSGAELDAPVLLARDEGTLDTWRYEGGDGLAPSKVKSMLRTLRALFLAEVVGDGDQGEELGDVRLQVELRLADGRVLAGRFGSVKPDGSVLASRMDTAWVVRFTRATWENLSSQARSLVE